MQPTNFYTAVPIILCAHPVNGDPMKVTRTVYDANPEKYTLYKKATFPTPPPVSAGAVTMEETPAPFKAAQDSVNKRAKRKTQKQVSKKRK